MTHVLHITRALLRYSGIPYVGRLLSIRNRKMLRSLFMMAIGAFLAIAFVDPVLFDEVRDQVKEVSAGLFTIAKEELDDKLAE